MTLIGHDNICATCSRHIFGDAADHMKEHVKEARGTFESSFDTPEARAKVVEELSRSVKQRTALTSLLYGDREEIAGFLAFLTEDDEATWARLLALMDEGGA